MKLHQLLLLILSNSLEIPSILAFSPPLLQKPTQLQDRKSFQLKHSNNDQYDNQNIDPMMEQHKYGATSRRALLSKTAKSILTVTSGSMIFDASTNGVPSAQAAVGSLPELADANAYIQGLTVNIADVSQYEKMIDFCKDSFDFLVLRERNSGSVKECWLGFGPEQASIPADFEIPVSSFAMYGGHASIHLRYDASSPSLLYNGKGDAPGNNIAYLQVGVPTYRISQMVKNGGNVLDAFGIVNVVSPVGLPMRGIVGISPDPMMFIAINTSDMQGSQNFYETLGLTKQPYPYCRPNQGMGQFEPPQPDGSVYLSHSPNSMGILLLPSVDPEKRRKKIPVVPNPVLRGINIVYNPTEEGDNNLEALSGKDPSEVGIAFSSNNAFEKEVRSLTRAS